MSLSLAKALTKPGRCNLPFQAKPLIRACPNRRIIARAADSKADAPAAPKAPIEYIEDKDFTITKISYGSILTPIGLGLMVYGFAAYFTLVPGLDLSTLMLIYGFPISILGFALSYAQLEPVPCKTTKQAFDMRDQYMTDNQKQIREDVTRFRYGDEQHLDEALNKVFKLGRQGGIPRKLTPVLIGLREEVVDGAYTLIMEFESKMKVEQWMPFQPKIQSFFGPGIMAKLEQTEKGVDVFLMSDGSGAGRGGGEKKDVLPPLMPGLKPRQQ